MSNTYPLLTILLLLPLAGLLCLLPIWRCGCQAARWIALGTGLLELALCSWLLE